jgi:hypothetical protein
MQYSLIRWYKKAIRLGPPSDLVLSTAEPTGRLDISACEPDDNLTRRKVVKFMIWAKTGVLATRILASMCGCPLASATADGP